jgi:steroid 5-alpha reductase family enzyme
VSLPELLLVTGSVIAVAMFVLWLVSLRVRDASIVDPFWGSAFVVVAWSAAVVVGAWDTHDLIVVGMVTVWGSRLSIYLLWRNLGKGEDYRYQAMRRRWGPRFWIISLATVFLLQGVLVWVVSLPVQVAILGPGDPGLLTAAGLALWSVGLIFETVGDAQLARFKADPSNDGKVMDRGLWRYTRHPNYFGDFCIWWGIYLAAIDASGTAWTVIGPLVMSYLLLRVSGVAMLERTIGKRRPGYEEYARRTNAFFPGPVKKA